MAKTKFNFDRVLANVDKMKQELPRVLANDAVRYFNDSFRKAGWDGQRWETPKRKIPGTYEYKYPKKNAKIRQSRAILVQSGRLRRAVATSVKLVSFNVIRFVVDLPYAAVHNEGGPIRGGKMPRRKFMGDSKTLRNLQKAKIRTAIDKIWKA